MISKTAALFAFVTPVACDPSQDPHWPAFEDFIKQHNRQYSSAFEVAGKFEIFKDNLQRIEERNARGQETHGVNQFADMTPEEFKSAFLGRVAGNWTAMTVKYPTPHDFTAVRATADSINWCDQGACTAVKDQGQCGSCWAFGGTEMVESDYFIRFGTLYDLSTQQPTSCDTLCGGCAGGNAVAVWQYINETGGQDSASAYPYTSGTTQQTGTCQSAEVVPANFKVGVAEAFWLSLSAADEGNMLIDIELTPMSVAVEADVWQFYTGGVITSSSGCGTALDHNVQVVGYNSDGNYWIVRNSWSAAWGESGFVYVEAGANVCGIAMEASAVVTQAPAGKAGVVV